MPRTRNSTNTTSASAPTKKRRTKDSGSPIEEGESNAEIQREDLRESEAESEERKVKRKRAEEEEEEEKKKFENCRFVGEPVNEDLARQRWPHRYLWQEEMRRKVQSKKSGVDEEELVQARRHYLKAEVDGKIYELGDDAHVQSEDEKQPYICNVIELFEGVDGVPYFRAQWFYRAIDTKIKNGINLTESKRVFFSEVKDDNELDCLVERLKISRVSPNVDKAAKQAAVPECDYYCDMAYLLPYSTFTRLPFENGAAGSESLSTISSETDSEGVMNDAKSVCTGLRAVDGSEMTLLDLYCGCGAMSTGLCLGANIYGVNLVTRWAVDTNSEACQSLKLNHPETEVRNESVGDFLELLKEWEKLCICYSLIKGDKLRGDVIEPKSIEEDEDGEDEEISEENDSEVFEVERILGICYGSPKKDSERGVYLKVRWKGYGEEEDSWEPLDGLGDCQEIIKKFVTDGLKAKLLPLPGQVDVICGGPPCQGVSGFNRFRNKEKPLDDPKNEQLKVYMDVIDYLKPRYALMENVVDLLRFKEGFLGRYALGRLVDMNYQARMGIMAAGAYGLPQFRLRTFLWGALPTKKLPPFPLPTHDVVLRGNAPVEFERCLVAHDEGSKVELEKKLFIGDAISDLPPVTNDESRDEISYESAPQTDFQRSIRLKKDALFSSSIDDPDVLHNVLYDHRPYKCNQDDYERVCQIPKKKGACFRDLPGVIVRPDNKVELDPSMERVLLSSKKPLVPNYAISFVDGTSSKPFGRLWYDETVPTVVTRAEPHNQVIIHPHQDRVLTVRENARLQGFPDYYQLKGPVKERYVQVGNAVAVPVARALGYALAMASQGACSDEPLITLPRKFPIIQAQAASPSVEDNS